MMAVLGQCPVKCKIVVNNKCLYQAKNFKCRICLRNLRTFFFNLAAEKSECVKYADFFFVEVLIWVLF